MASFFDNLTDKMNVLGNKIVDATTSSTENIKLSNAIKTEERQIADNYKEIGIKYRELFGSDPAPEMAALIQDIAKREMLIAEYRKKIQQNKGKVVCTGCGAEIDSTTSFCTKCGTKNPVAEEIAKAKAEAAAKAQAEAEAKAKAQADAAAAKAKAQAEAAAKAQNAQTEAAQAQVNQTAETAAATGAAPSPAPASEKAAPEVIEPEVTVSCKNCGSPVAADCVFCTNCGNRLDG